MWRWASAFLVATVLVGPVRANDRPFGYAEAVQAFANLSVEQRIRLQTYLDAAGFWPAVPNTVFGVRLFNAITQFQSANGFPANGAISLEQVARLQSIAGPLFAQWGFQSIAHPDVGVRIWVPMGLGLTGTGDQNGLKFTDYRGRVALDYGYYPSTSLEAARASWLEALARGGEKIGYNVTRRDFFAITAENGSKSFYIRFHRFRSGSLGFVFSFDNTDVDLHGDRLETLISSSMWSELTPGAPFIPLPIIPSAPMQSASLPPSPPSAPTTVAPQPNISEPLPSGPPKESSGTAFYIDVTGHLMTNAHVVEDCTEISIAGPNGPLPVRVVARDTTNDLALLKADVVPERVAELRTGVRLGEGVEAFGYPLTNVLSTSGNFTLGNVTALAGLKDDSRYFQISTPVQPGNSGGPLLDAGGNFVGIVTAKLNALKMMVANNGDIPQNVNFAIKGSVVATFLDGNGVQFKTASLGAILPPADVADRAKAMSAYVRCH